MFSIFKSSAQCDISFTYPTCLYSDSSISFTNTASSVTNSSFNPQYQWVFQSATTPVYSTDASFTFSPSSSYSVSLTLLDAACFNLNGQNAYPTVTHTLNITDNLSVDFINDTSLNQSTTVNLGNLVSVSGGVSPYSYSWSSTTGLLSSTSTNPSLTIDTFQIVTLQITDSRGCIRIEDLLFNTFLNTPPKNMVVAGEYFWDSDPGEGGGTAILALDGNFNQSFEDFANNGIQVP